MNEKTVELLKRCREQPRLGVHRFNPAIDETALEVAQECRRRLSQGLRLSLTWEQWTQLTAILQSEIAITIRHAVFEERERVEIIDAERPE